MGHFIQYLCSVCKHRFTLGGPQEYTNILGYKLLLKHPGKGQKKRISGFVYYFWCQSCASVQREVITRFNKKVSALEAWSGSALSSFYKPHPKCRKCKEVLLTHVPETTFCPFCKSEDLKIKYDYTT